MRAQGAKKGEGEVVRMHPAGSSAEEAGEGEREKRALERLASLRKERARLEEREAELQGKVEESEGRELELLEALEGLKSDLADGGSAEEIPALASKLEAQRVATAALREARSKIEAEVAKVEGEIREIERGIERRRQALAVVPFLEEHAAFLKSWVAGVVAVNDPLREAKALRARIAREFPLAAPPAAPTFTGLVRQLSEAFPPPDHGQDFAVRLSCLSWLKGPVGAFNHRAAVISSERLAELGIEDK